MTLTNTNTHFNMMRTVSTVHVMIQYRMQHSM